MIKNVFSNFTALSFAIVATVMLASCAKEELDTENPVQYGKPRNVAISATWESGNINKAYMDADSRNVNWQNGDLVNFNGTQLAVSNIDGTTAKFSGTISPIVNGASDNIYYGVYPISLNPNFTYEGVTITLPAVQSYNSTPLDKSNIMVGRSITSSDNISIGFKNVCAVLKIGLKCKTGETGDNAKIGKIVLSSTNSKLSGNATITFNSENAISSAAMANDALNQVTLNCGDGASLNSSSFKYFYIMVPNTAVGKNLTMKIYDVKGFEMTKTISNLSNALLSNHVYTTELTTNFVRDYAPHPFSVSATKKVYFSNGNLWYKVSDNTWHFENEQYGYHTRISGLIDGGSGESFSTPDGYGLFEWSCGTANNFGVELGIGDGSTFTDWGYHPIVGGDGTTVYPAGTWYTLSAAEWTWLTCGNRNGTGESFPEPTNRFVRQRAFCKVNFGSVTRGGIVLMPDDYTGDISGYEGSNMSSSKWNELQSAGAVFLPAVGMCVLYNGNWLAYSFNTYAMYWTSSRQPTPGGAWDISVSANDWTDCPNGSSQGQPHPVRLVRDAN